MLSRLSIKNYALIEESEIGFDEGFSVITGETGAGKSILLGALSLLLGARADRSVLRDPSQKCIVEGTFKKNKKLDIFLSKHELEISEQIVLRREVAADGKSRSFVNDSLVTLQVLKEISTNLIHLNLQKENIRFLSPESQIEALDAFAQNEVQRNQYVKAFQKCKLIELELKRTKNQLILRTKEKEFNQFRLEELDLANLKNEHELVELEAEFKRLDQSTEIIRFLNDLENSIQGDISNQLYALNQQSGRFKETGKDLSDLSDRLNGIFLEVKDLAEDASRMLANFEVDPNRQEEVEQRLSQLYKLLKKYQVDTLLELQIERDRLSMDLKEDGQLEWKIGGLEKELEGAFKDLEKAAQELTNSRISIQLEFEKKIKALFPLVHLPHAILMVKIDSLPEYTDHFSGKDQVSFWFNANPGMDLQPLDQIASGGELSRITLVIKSIISEKEEMPTLVFDEVDAGISGEAAIKVGELLRKLSGFGQVIAITHLPQIAAQASHHFQVEKHVIQNQTKTTIQKVIGENRVNALVSLLGVEETGDGLKKYVEELLEKFRI